MKCQKCVDEGKKSAVYPDGYGVSTLMASHPYYDEDGVYHNHDWNSRTTGASCSNGHRWWMSITPKCPSCDYGGIDKITWENDDEKM